MPEGGGGFCLNGHGDDALRWEDILTQELVPAIDERYRTVPKRSQRAISGASTGGFAAVALGLRHPHLFGSVASHSGAFGILEPGGSPGALGSKVTAVFGPEGSETRRRYELEALLDGLAVRDRPHIYFDCGSADFLLPRQRAFAKELSDRKWNYEYREGPGSHDGKYWAKSVRASLASQLEELSLRGELSSPSDEPVDPKEFVGTWNARGELPVARRPTRSSRCVSKATSCAASPSGTMERRVASSIGSPFEAAASRWKSKSRSAASKESSASRRPSAATS